MAKDTSNNSLLEVQRALKHVAEVRRLAEVAGFSQGWLESDAKYVARLRKELADLIAEQQKAAALASRKGILASAGKSLAARTALNALLASLGLPPIANLFSNS